MSEALLKKPLTGLLLLAGAAGGPYFLFETDVGKMASNVFVPSQTQTSDEVPVGQFTNSNAPSTALIPGGGLAVAPHILNQPDSPTPHAPVLSLSEVLRFDITPGWVTSRFPRVSTVVGNGELDGMRVPLVTGTSPTDLAGTLTYYFDHYQRLQRISLQSVSGDPNRFIGELQNSYQLQQQPSLGGNLYLLSWNGQATSVLQVTPAAVIRADAPYSRYEMFLELNQPGLQYGLSADAHGRLQAGRASQRW